MKMKYKLLAGLVVLIMLGGCFNNDDDDVKTSGSDVVSTSTAAAAVEPVEAEVAEEPEVMESSFVQITDAQITEFKELMEPYGSFEFDVAQSKNDVNIVLKYPDHMDAESFEIAGKFSILLLMSVSNDTEPYGNVVKSINNYEIKLYGDGTYLGSGSKLANSEEITWDIPESTTNLWFEESESRAWAGLGAYVDSTDAIIQITTDPYLTGSDKWGIMHAYISDGWYYLEDYQKKRVAKNIGDSITLILYESGVVEDGAPLKIHIHDSYGTEVAENSLWTGEYTIYE